MYTETNFSMGTVAWVCSLKSGRVHSHRCNNSRLGSENKQSYMVRSSGYILDHRVAHNPDKIRLVQCILVPQLGMSATQSTVISTEIVSFRFILIWKCLSRISTVHGEKNHIQSQRYTILDWNWIERLNPVFIVCVQSFDSVQIAI